MSSGDLPITTTEPTTTTSTTPSTTTSPMDVQTTTKGLESLGDTQTEHSLIAALPGAAESASSTSAMDQQESTVSLVEQPAFGPDLTPGEVAQMQKLAATKIPVGVDNNTPFDLTDILNRLPDLPGGVPKLERAHMLINALRKPPHLAIELQDFGPVPGENVAHYAMPEIKPMPHKQEDEAIVYLPQSRTRKVPLIDTTLIADVWAKDARTRQCVHPVARSKRSTRCAPGCCVFVRKTLIVDLFLYPVTMDIENKSYSAVKERRQAELLKHTQQQVRQIELKRFAPEEPKKKKELTKKRKEDLEVHPSWLKGRDENTKSIITVCTMTSRGDGYCGTRINRAYRQSFYREWERICFGTVRDPGCEGVLIGSRMDKECSREDPEYLRYNGSKYTAEDAPPTVYANGVVMEYYREILKRKFRPLGWDGCLVEGMQIVAEIVPAELYNYEGWEKGNPIPPRLPNWPDHTPGNNWVVKRFRIREPPVERLQQPTQPVVNSTLGFISNVITFGAHYHRQFKLSKDPVVRQYAEKLTKEAEATGKAPVWDFTKLPPDERDNYAPWGFNKPPPPYRIRHVEFMNGAPPHCKVLKPSKDFEHQELEQLKDSELYRTTDFSPLASATDLKADYNLNALTSVVQTVPYHMLRDHQGRRLSELTKPPPLLGQPILPTYTFYTGMPSNYQLQPSFRPCTASVGLLANATAMYSLAPQRSPPDKLRLWQLRGLHDNDQRAIMARLVRAGIMLLDIKREQLERIYNSCDVDVRLPITKGSYAEPIIEALLPIDPDNGQCVFKFQPKINEPVKLKTWLPKQKMWRGANCVITKTYPAYRFNIKKAKGRTRTEVLADWYKDTEPPKGMDLYNKKSFLFFPEEISLERMLSSGQNFKHDLRNSVFTCEPEGFAGDEKIPYWDHIGTVVQMTPASLEKTTDILKQHVFENYRYFVLEETKPEIVRTQFAAISPLTTERILDNGQIQFQHLATELEAIQKEQGRKAKIQNQKTAEILENTRYSIKSERLKEGLENSDQLADHVLTEQLTQAKFPTDLAMPKFSKDSWAESGIETPGADNVHPKNILKAAVQGMLPLKHQMHTRFPTSAQTKEIAARPECQGFLKQTGFRYEPTEVQLDIAVRATVCLGEGRQPIIDVEGPAGNGKTVSFGHCLYAVINYFRIRYRDGYPLRPNCNPEYWQKLGPLLKLNTMAALVIATTNYAIEHAAMQFYTDLVAPPQAIEGYSYFNKPSKGKFHFLRHVGTNKKAMDSEVSHATQFMIAMYHDSPNTPEEVKINRELLTRNARKVKDLLNGLPAKQKKEDQKEANQDVQEAQKLCAESKAKGMEMWDLVMEHCSIDAVFVTAALLVDVRLKHPNLNFHTLFVEESSQMHISHLLMGIDLLSTKVSDPCVILYGDKHQMPVMTKTTGRAKSISDLGILGILTDPATEIAAAMGYPRSIWDNLRIPDPLPVTEVHHLDVQYRMTEPLCGFARHNVYINSHFKPTFKLHESLTDPPHRTYSSKREKREGQHREDRIPDPEVIKIVSSSAKRYSCAHLPQLRLGHQLWNINVTEGMEKTDATSKTHDVMTKICLNMLELQLWYRKAFPGEDVTVITYYDTQRQDMLRGLQNLHTKYGKFRVLRYHQPVPDAKGHLQKSGGFEKLETSFLDVKVVNLATIQGKENKVIYVLIPRMLSIPKIKRLHAAEVYLQPRSKWETAENVPIINFEALKRLPQLVHNFLGFVADANKTTVALTRATQMLFVLQNFHTTDLDPLWNQFNQMTHSLGLTTTHPLQVYQDAYAHSDVPDDWYWEDERCMHKPRMPPGRQRNIKPIRLTDQVTTCGVVDVDRDELICPANYSNNFYRKPMNTSYRALKEEDHDCTRPQLPQIRPAHVKQVRKDVGRIKAENPRLYRLWLRTISREEEYEQGGLRLDDDLTETELYAAEDVAAFRLEQANQLREQMEEEDRKAETAAKEYQERMLMEVTSEKGPVLQEFYTEFIPKGVSPEQRRLRIIAGDPLYEPPADEDMEEESEDGQVSDEEEEEEGSDSGKSVETIVDKAKLHKTQYNAVIRDFKAFRWLEGVYSSPLFQNLITLYMRHKAEFAGMDLKLPGNWAELEDESLFMQCADSEANVVFLNDVRQSELTDERRRSRKFQLLTFEAIRYSTHYKEANLKHAKNVQQMMALPNHRYNYQGELYMVREGITPTVFTGPYLDDEDATEFNLIAEFENAIEPSLGEVNIAMPALAGEAADEAEMGDLGGDEEPVVDAEGGAQAVDPPELEANVAALQEQLEADAQQQLADDAAKYAKKEAPDGEGN